MDQAQVHTVAPRWQTQLTSSDGPRDGARDVAAFEKVCFRDTVLAADIRCIHSNFLLTQDANDLLFCES